MSRADRVADVLDERGLDLLLVTNLVNLRYLTGFTGLNGIAVVGPRRAPLHHRLPLRRAGGRAGRRTSTASGRRRTSSMALGEGWPEGSLRLGFEDDHVSVRRHGRLREVVPERIELVPAGGRRGIAAGGQGRRRDREDGAAAALVDAVYGMLREQGLVGRTEREVALALENEMRRLGAEAPSFSSIVASAERGALPHAVPTDEPIPRDTLVTLDIGAQLDGYCSDCTRTWATGALPDDLAEAYALVLRAQEAALDAVRPGPDGRAVDAVARGIIEEAGHGEHFGHGLGHGVGLEIHEAPRLAKSGDAPLVAGNIVTVEPGVYLPGRGGVRIEDLVVVTEAAATCCPAPRRIS